MSTNDNLTKRTRQQNKIISPIKLKNETRVNKLKQIDAIYKSQINQIYNHHSPNFIDKNNQQDRDDKTNFSRKALENKHKTVRIGAVNIDDIENISTSSRALHSVVSEDKFKSSKYIGSDTSKNTNLLKIQNQNKDRKINDLTNKCEYLLQKLRNHISANQFSQEVQALNALVENKIQRFENLFKIKNQQIFFKIKLQVISLLQDFEVPQQDLGQINEIHTEASLFTFLSKKIKTQLKLFRNKDQQNKFQLHKDKILNQKLQGRLTYLTQTNELLKISQQKLKLKNQTLKTQMHEYLQKIKQKQLELEQKDCEAFRFKRESQQMLSNSSKVQQLEKKFKEQQQMMAQRFQLKEKQFKNLLNIQSIQKKRLQAQIQQKDCLIQQILIKEKYLIQQNQRINRQLVRSKERYEWCERQLQNRRKQYDEEKNLLQEESRKYKENNNQSMLLYAKAQTDDAIRKIDQYQQAYTRITIQLQEEKRASQLKYEEYLNKLEAIEQTWLEKTKRIEQIRMEELQQISKDYEEKHQQLRRQTEIKQKNTTEEMQAKIKTLLAEKDKKFTEKQYNLQQQNDNLRRQLEQQKQLNGFLQSKK